jgi:hypothetical protein
MDVGMLKAVVNLMCASGSGMKTFVPQSQEQVLCFHGTDAVNWLIKQTITKDRVQSIALAQQLVFAGMLLPLNNPAATGPSPADSSSVRSMVGIPSSTFQDSPHCVYFFSPTWTQPDYDPVPRQLSNLQPSQLA